MNMSHAANALKSMYIGKHATKNAWVFVWLIFVIFVGFAISGYVFSLDIEEWYRWTVFGIVIALSVIGLIYFWWASTAGRSSYRKGEKDAAACARAQHNAGQAPMNYNSGQMSMK